MPTFRPYTREELHAAANEYDIDPAFVEAVYAVESSRGTDPNAMRARSVKRKRDSTIVRGPFQLEDDTTSDLIKKHKLGTVDVDDPGAHLELAMRLMSDLKDTYGGDYRKMAQAYLGGAGGVANSAATDELGTSTGSYGNRILAEMERVRAAGGGDNVDMIVPTPRAPKTYDAVPNEQMQFLVEDGNDDLLGIPSGTPTMGSRDDVSWRDLIAASRTGGGSGLGIPMTMGGELSDDADDPMRDLQTYVAGLANEELDGKDYAAA